MSITGEKLHEEAAVWFLFPVATLGESQTFYFPCENSHLQTETTCGERENTLMMEDLKDAWMFVKGKKAELAV